MRARVAAGKAYGKKANNANMAVLGDAKLRTHGVIEGDASVVGDVFSKKSEKYLQDK